MSIPGRSTSVQASVASVVTKLGPHATVPVDRLLAALVSPAMAYGMSRRMAPIYRGHAVYRKLGGAPPLELGYLGGHSAGVVFRGYLGGFPAPKLICVQLVRFAGQFDFEAF